MISEKVVLFEKKKGRKKKISITIQSIKEPFLIRTVNRRTLWAPGTLKVMCNICKETEEATRSWMNTPTVSDQKKNRFLTRNLCQKCWNYGKPSTGKNHKSSSVTRMIEYTCLQSKKNPKKNRKNNSDNDYNKEVCKHICINNT